MNNKFKDIQDYKKKELKEGYLKTLLNGFVSDATGANYIYCKASSFEESLSAQMDLLGAEAEARINGTYVNFYVWNISKETRTCIPHTLSEIQQVISDGAARKQGLIAHLEQQVSIVEAIPYMLEMCSDETIKEKIESIKWDPKI